MNKKENKFILIDGMDCSGKTTLINLIKEHINADVIKEPLDKYRDEIMDTNTSTSRREDLFLLGRNELNLTIPDRLKDSHVISDSGGLRGLAYCNHEQYSKILHNYINQPNRPSTIYFLDVTYDTFKDRMIKRVEGGEPMDILESIDKEVFSQRREDFYLTIYKLMTRGFDIRVYNVDDGVEHVSKDIIKYLTRK